MARRQVSSPLPAGYGSTLHRASSPRRAPPGQVFDSPVTNVAQQLNLFRGSSSPPRASSPNPGSNRVLSSAEPSSHQKGLMADFKKGYSADKRKTMEIPIQRAAPSGTKDDLLAEVVSLRSQIAVQRAEEDRLGISCIPGGASGMASAILTAKAEANELKAALRVTNIELDQTRGELHAASRRLAQIERDKRRVDAGGPDEAVERVESMALRAGMLARITALRSVCTTLVNMLEIAKRRLRRDGEGAGDASSSPATSAQDVWLLAESSVADCLSTLRSLAVEQEAVAKDITSMARLLPPDQVLAQETRLKLAALAAEADAIASAEILEDQRDAARAECAAKGTEAQRAIAMISNKLADQISRAEKLELKLAAERPRVEALDIALISAQSSLTLAQSEKDVLFLRVQQLEGEVRERGREAKEAQTRAEAAFEQARSRCDTLSKTLALSEIQRAQAESSVAAADSRAVRADSAYIAEKSSKIALHEKLMAAQRAVDEVVGQLKAEEARRGSLESTLADLARKPGPDASVDSGGQRASTPARTRAYGPDEPLRPAPSPAAL